MTDKNTSQGTALHHNISPLSAWALSIGTSIGWGSFIITSNTHLAGAGPLGSALGMVIGALVMLVIAENYHCMMKRYPEAGGVYTYVKKIFGYGDGFLVAWFLALTYFAMLWANATSLPLFAHYFLGDVFCFGRLYTLFGYEVWLGEALISILALLAFALLCMKKGAFALRLNAVLALIFTLGISFCFTAAMLSGGAGRSFEPRFIPEGSAIAQITRMAFISPWAFVGFENISHAAEEFRFPVKRSFRVLTVSVVVTTLLYLFVTLLSVTAYPPEYTNWLAYIRDLDNLEGLEALPAFYAARHYLGVYGVGALMLALLALVVSSLIGNILALSRLFYSLAVERIMPWRYCHTNRHGIPDNAIRLIALISCVVPFVGRTAIGWIVDVTTLGATLIYGFVSASVWKLAGKRGDRLDKRLGILGTVLMTGFGAYLLVPNLFAAGSIETESYFLFVIWAVLGLGYFHTMLRRDKEKRFGNNMVVWVAFLSLIVFVTLVWSAQYNMRTTAEGIDRIHRYYMDTGSEIDGSAYVQQVLDQVRAAEGRGILAVAGTFALSLGMLISNYATMSRRAIASETELGKVKHRASTDPLTGVKSKLAYAEKEAEINAAIQKGEAGEFAVAICDVNGLKLVNDTHGHKAGDRYIFDSCRLVCLTFKHSPVFRIGGDEFAVILRGMDFENREQLMELFDRRVEENLDKPDQPVVAIGMATYDPARDVTFHSVFERADSSMYSHKQRLKDMGVRTRD